MCAVSGGFEVPLSVSEGDKFPDKARKKSLLRRAVLFDVRGRGTALTQAARRFGHNIVLRSVALVRSSATDRSLPFGICETIPGLFHSNSAMFRPYSVAHRSLQKYRFSLTGTSHIAHVAAVPIDLLIVMRQ